MHLLLRRFLISALILLPFSYSMPAQELAASITGSVTDASGAIISGATVKIDSDTIKGSTRTVQTDKSGSYTITNLSPGAYTVTIKDPNFETFTAKDVTIFVAEKRTVNARLQAGSVSQTVTVQENTASIELSSSEQAGTVSGTQVRELELSNRNFEQLVTLQPGVVSGLGDETGFGLNNTTTLSVNGGRDTGNNWSVDGADINDSGSNATLLNVPSVDAIQEFTLERGSYDASYGRSGGAQVLVATKQGTSEYHGDLYEFVRNDKFNANTYFGNQTDTPRGIERYNDYGFTLGGPIFIPKIYDQAKNKAFFFWSEEWRKVSSPSTNSVLAPTAAQLNGNFNATTAPTSAPGCVSYNAATGNGTISPSCYSKNAKVYLTNVFDLFPANSGDNYVSTYSSLNNVREDIVRVDYNVSDKVHFFGRAMQDETPENFPTGLFAGANYPNLVNTAVNAPGENIVGNLTYTITPNLVNEAEFAYSQGAISATLSGAANSPAVLSQLTNNYAYKDPYDRIPSVVIYSGTTGLTQGSAPYSERNLDRTLFDNLSWTHGKHTVRTGFTVSQMLKTENADSGGATFNFNTFQDFLLGNVATYSQASRDTVPDLHYVNMEAYALDDWKVTPRLTLNLGLRWSYFPSPTDVKNTLNNFDPELYNPSLAPTLDSTGSFVAGSSNIPATYINGLIFPQGAACAQAKAIAPGVTCSPFGSRVNPNSNRNFAPRVGFAFDPFGTGKTSIRGGFGIFYDRTLNGIWEQNAFADPPLVQTSTVNNTSFDNPLQGTNAVSLGPNLIVSTGTPAFRVPSYLDYSVSFQQQLDPSTVLEIAYVGTGGRHSLGELDLNQPTLGSREANPNVNVNNIRPYLGYSYFRSRIPGFTNSYNSLQVSVNHRVTRGLTLGIAYTWSKNLTSQSTDRGAANTDTYNPQLDYGPSSLNTPQIFIANYVYQLPFFKQQHGFTGHALGGWEVSGITSFESGQSFSVTQAEDPFACIASTTTANGCEAGTYPGGLGIVSPDYDIAPRVDQVANVHLTKKLNQWFTTSSYIHAVGHFGSESNGSILGPGVENWDLGAIKNVQFAERYKFQFRGEFFNAFNHTNYAGVDSGIDDTSFGQVTSTHLPRRIQLGAKLYF